MAEKEKNPGQGGTTAHQGGDGKARKAGDGWRKTENCCKGELQRILGFDVRMSVRKDVSWGKNH